MQNNNLVVVFVSCLLCVPIVKLKMADIHVILKTTPTPFPPLKGQTDNSALLAFFMKTKTTEKVFFKFLFTFFTMINY